MDKAGGAKARSVEASCRSAEAFLKESAAWIEARLDRILPPASAQPRRLHGAMRYSLFAGGKRLRPALVLATTRMLGGTNEGAAAAACALEMIHTYSLIHDDLPAMDNDDLRRGRPTCHRKFGEALAILAGDALLTLAFETLAKHPRREDVPALVGVLASSAGTHGMAGGQVLDLLAEGKPATRAGVRAIHRWKTAALMAAACELGAIAAGGSAAQRRRLRKFGLETGLAFQIADDVLDATSSPEELGKTPGKDLRAGKATYPAAVGVAAAKRAAEAMARRAARRLDGLGPRARTLRDLALFAARRGR